MSYLGNKPAEVPLTSADLADSIVTSAKIADDTIVNVDVNNISATKITAGTVATARLGSGTASSSTVLYGDQTYKAEPTGVSLATSTDNQVVTVTGADAITGETNFIYNGTIVGAGADGANADLGAGVHIKAADSGASVSTDFDELVIENSASAGISILAGTGEDSGIDFGDSGGSQRGRFIYAHNGDNMMFHTAGTEKMRINSNGSIGIGASWDTWYLTQIRFNGNAGGAVVIDNTQTDSNEANYLNFKHGNTSIGKITKNGTTAAILYTTTSDYRLKENVTDKTDGIEKIKLLKPKKFNWIADASNQNIDGFLAHEVQEVIPEAITGVKDALEKYKQGQEIPEGKSVGDNVLDENEDTIIDPQGIDMSSLVPVTVACLKQLITKIETLEAKVTALENA